MGPGMEGGLLAVRSVARTAGYQALKHRILERFLRILNNFALKNKKIIYFLPLGTKIAIDIVYSSTAIYKLRGIIMNELSTFNSLFDNIFGSDYVGARYVASPRVDIKEEKDAYTLEMELPGHCEKDVNIELDKDNLTVSSVENEAKEKSDKNGKYILKERTSRSFCRRFILPKDVDSEKISAKFANGVLTIDMQKKANCAPKRIEIGA